MTGIRPAIVCAAALLVAIPAVGLGPFGMVERKAAAAEQPGQDVLVLRDGGTQVGSAAVCDGRNCTLDGTSVPREHIAWIGLGVATTSLPTAAEPARDALYLRDGSVYAGRLLHIATYEVAIEGGSHPRDEVAWVHFGGARTEFAATHSRPTQMAPPMEPATRTTAPADASPPRLVAVPTEAHAAPCGPVRTLATRLVPQLEPKVSAGMRKQAAEVVAEARENGRSEADGYNAFSVGALLQGESEAAAWGALKATLLDDNARHVGNAGVKLIYLARPDEAGTLLDCAEAMTPDAGPVIEAQAMLALHRKDFPRAKELILRAIALMPGDMNVLYAAGIIHFDAGDRAAAARFFSSAQQLAPYDETVYQALKAADPRAKAPPRPRDGLDWAVEECFRHMDEMLLKGESVARMLAALYEESRKVSPPLVVLSHGSEDARDLRRHVTRSKEHIRLSRLRDARDARGRPLAIGWNTTILECIQHYFEATSLYKSIVNDGTHLILVSASMRMTPKRVVERTNVQGLIFRDLVILDAEHRFNQIAMPAQDKLNAGLTACDQAYISHRSKATQEACRRAQHADYCSTAVPAWITYRDDVMPRLDHLAKSHPRVLEDYVNYWIPYANEAALYARRALALMRPIDEKAVAQVLSPEAGAARARAAYQTYIGGGVVGWLVFNAGMTERTARDLNEGVPKRVSAPLQWDYFLYCEQDPLESPSLDEEIEALLAALKEAGEYEVAFDPDCELSFGGVSISVKPLDFQGVQVQSAVGSASLGGEQRAGASLGHSASVGGSVHGVSAEVGATVWVEAGADGPNVGAQLNSKLGLGVEAGAVAAKCVLFKANATYTSRALARQLRA